MSKASSTLCAKDEERPLRITRSRAKILGGPSSENEGKRATNSKRVVSSENKTCVVVPDVPHRKRRAALTDVSNITAKPHDKRVKQSNFQAKGVYQKKNTKLASDVFIEVSSAQEDVKEKVADELSTMKMVESNNTIAAVTLVDEPTEHCMSNNISEHVMTDTTLSMQECVNSGELATSPSPNKDINMICEKIGASDCLTFVDIDKKLKDSQIWSAYAPDIYTKVRVTELEKRPSTNYMEKLQQDISPSMRGILIDWLVEVSEEYKLVPDTLYLTVNLIDRFLSTSLIQKHRLQLLGVTCMFIASKYEEMCAPRVEEFCFITDNTYTKEEVVKMEKEVLNLLRFQLSVPTTKTFLRRFIQAAQSSYKVPLAELEFLANYLAELTLVEYSFLQFLPSRVAASAVFLARWTLNHSEHPWTTTLEHFTNYKASDLKPVVLALEDLQLNTKGCSLHAIRDKYKQEKFNGVAKLSPKPVQSLFQAQV